MMIYERSLTLFLLVIQLISQSESSNAEHNFDRLCSWSEEVTYHTHYGTSCNTYFSCQRGKFIDVYRCPDSTRFNTETLRCEDNVICKEVELTPQNFRVVFADMLYEAIEAFLNYTYKPNIASSTTTAEVTQTDLGAFVTAFSSSTILPKALLQTKYPLLKSTESSDKDQSFSIDIGNPKVRGSISLPHVTKSASDSTKEIDSSNPVAKIPTLNTEPSHSSANSPETETLSVHIIPMQFDTQTLLLTEKLSSSATAKALQKDYFSRTFDHSSLPNLAVTPNPTQGNAFFNGFILPLVQDLVKNSTIMSKVKLLMDAVFETANPIMYQILDQQVDEKLGSAITFSLKELKEAINQTAFVARPILRQILRYSSHTFFINAVKNNDILLDYMFNDDSIIDIIPSIMGTSFNLIFKYDLLRKISPSDHLTTFSLMEIRKDMKDVFEIFSYVFGGKFH